MGRSHSAWEVRIGHSGSASAAQDGLRRENLKDACMDQAKYDLYPTYNNQARADCVVCLKACILGLPYLIHPGACNQLVMLKWSTS